MTDHAQKTELALAALERRAMMKKAGTGLAAGLAMAAFAGGAMKPSAAEAATTLQTPTAGPTPLDVNILTFALNLEYLEAQYYLNAVTGTGLTAAQRAGGSGQTGGTPIPAGKTAVPFVTPIIQQYAEDIASDELAHVLFLKAALGSAAIPAPVLDVTANGAFTTLARAAGVVGANQTFNPYHDELSFLLGAYVFEDVGVTAYGGAAALISQPSALVQYAASILAVEAYHAGTIRTLLSLTGGGEATDAISNLRSTLSSGSGAGTPQGDDFGTLGIMGAEGPPPVGASASKYGRFMNPEQTVAVLAPVDSNALTYRRSVKQVLNIVYGNSNATPGLFFPNGLNTLPGVTGFS